MALQLGDYSYILQNAKSMEAGINKGEDVLVSWLLSILIEHCWLEMQIQRRLLEEAQREQAAG